MFLHNFLKFKMLLMRDAGCILAPLRGGCMVRVVGAARLLPARIRRERSRVCVVVTKMFRVREYISTFSSVPAIQRPNFKIPNVQNPIMYFFFLKFRGF